MNRNFQQTNERLDLLEEKVATNKDSIEKVDKKINWMIGLIIISIGIPIFLKLFFP